MIRVAQLLLPLSSGARSPATPTEPMTVPQMWHPRATKPVPGCVKRRVFPAHATRPGSTAPPSSLGELCALAEALLLVR
jgi:hypothetical protein